MEMRKGLNCLTKKEKKNIEIITETKQLKKKDQHLSEKGAH